MKALIQFQKIKHISDLLCIYDLNRKSITKNIEGALLIILSIALPLEASAFDTSTVVSVDQRVSAGVEPALLRLHANPYALSVNSGKINVEFSVPLIGKVKPSDTVYLRRIGENKAIAMNDLGKDGDFKAADGIFAANVLIDTTKIKPDTCLNYEAFTRTNKTKLTSKLIRLCISSFPVHFVTPSITNPAIFSDGSKAVGDEILLRVATSASATSIKQLASSINAKITGSDLILNLYQLKLHEKVTAARLLEVITQLKSHKEVTSASVNALGTYSFTPSDTEFPSQHGLTLTRAHNAWDVNTIANGVGNTVIVLDTGIDRTHPDLGTSPGNCQLAEDDCGLASNDTVGHGTQVTGVITAKTNNALGVAGVAFGSKVHSIQVTPVVTISATDMINGFNLATSYIATHIQAKVINASFSAANAFMDWTPLCTAIDQAVFNGAVRAIVVNSAGNLNTTGAIYPGRCNDLNSGLDVSRKNLLITVANSTSISTPDCGSVAIDQRCANSIDGTMLGSNYGPWVDIAAPGSAIRSTTIGGGYASPTGTSFSAPIVSGAAAILSSCGVPLNEIEATLRTNSGVIAGTNSQVIVPFPDASSAPRLDIHRSLAMRNRIPTGVTISNSSVLENTNTAAGFEVGTLLADDLDTCDKFTYMINGGADAALFSIGGASLDRLRLTAGVLNYEVKNTYNVTVRVTDFFLQTFDQPLTINVIDVDEFDVGAVTDTNGAVNAVLENAANMSVVGITALASDADGTTNAITYSLTDNAGGRFAIGGSSGVVTVANGALLNRELAASHNITVRATSADTSFTDQVFTINITDVDEFDVGAVSDSNGVANAVAENAANTTVVGMTAVANDADATTNAISYSLTDSAGGRFAVDSSSGVVTVANGTLLDYETATSHNITVRATSADTSFTDQTFTVAITNVNDIAPVITSDGGGATAAINVVESTPMSSVSAVTTVTATDADAGVTTFVYSITGGADAARFAINSASGALTLIAPLPNFEFPTDVGGDNVYDVVVQVSDGGNTDSQAIAVTITNDASDSGEPHITTVGGLSYDFQSVGEFVALRNSANGMEIQTRQTAIPGDYTYPNIYTGLTTAVSVNTGVAVRVGTHRVTYQENISGIPDPSSLQLRVDGVLTTLPANGITFATGGRVVALGGGVIQIDFPDATTMVVIPGWWSTYNVWYLNINVSNTSAREGLMGARAVGGWLPKLSNGTSLGAKPASLHDRFVELYDKFGNSWRVNDKSSLFDYAKGTSTKTFTNLEFPSEIPPPPPPPGSGVKQIKLKAAQQICRAVNTKNENANCIFDVMVTGHPGFAKTYLVGQKVQAGLTRIVVRDNKDPSKLKEPVIFTATVTRATTKARRSAANNRAPTGTVQFTHDGRKVGEPVKLNVKGQAIWKATRLKPGKHQIAARYIPAKGSALLGSRSLDEMHSVSD